MSFDVHTPRADFMSTWSTSKMVNNAGGWQYSCGNPACTGLALKGRAQMLAGYLRGLQQSHDRQDDWSQLRQYSA